jgi:hypothetical protein
MYPGWTSADPNLRVGNDCEPGRDLRPSLVNTDAIAIMPDTPIKRRMDWQFSGHWR